jgi:UDP-N-acetylglucosamine transferase subunit ALG13
MIFVTVGSELPFDRLVRVVDEWAGANGRTDVFAQIAETEWRPKFIPYKQFLEPAEFAERLTSATVIVSHAGMGTILSALRHEKPILVMPRRATLREVRNEHQLATAQRLSEMGRISVALDEAELRVRLDGIGDLKPKEKISPYAGPELIGALRDFIARR